MDKQNYWGISLHLDLYDCDPLLINNRSHIKKYVIELCELIKMKRYGNPIIEWFGEKENVKGFSLVQLIQTSSITGHFAQHNNSAYLDIFSCKDFDPEKTSEFSFHFFKAKKIIHNYMERGKEI